MRKTLVICIREYLAAVRSKSFIISLVLLPLMMSGGIIAQRVGERLGDTSTKQVAIIDRTPEMTIFNALKTAAEQRNSNLVLSIKPASKFELEKIEPADLADGNAVDRQRLGLSKRVRSGELLAFVEIGPDLLKATHLPATLPADSEPDDRISVRYSSNRPTYRDFVNFLDATIQPAVRQKRLAEAGINYQQLRPLLEVPRTVNRGLAEQRQGQITYESKQGQLAPFAVPLVMVMLMYMVVMVGAGPMAANVVEEKQLRIAEVLLGSVRPFELMMGKLLGSVAVSMTLALIYCSGAYYLAVISGIAGQIIGTSIAWFVLFMVIGTMMYGAMFVAAGAAVTNIKEVQTLIMPIMLLVVIPLFFLGNVVEDPSGVPAMVVSMFPLSAPIMMTARIAIPPGAPIWQVLVAAVLTLSTTVVLVWAAGRIFRVGLLMQGQGARYADLARWIIRG